jgi:hypothetical protein
MMRYDPPGQRLPKGKPHGTPKTHRPCSFTILVHVERRKPPLRDQTFHPCGVIIAQRFRRWSETKSINRFWALWLGV